MRFTNTSWFPLKNFTKSEIHYDWMLGPTKFSTFKDSLTGEPIKKFTTILWNKTLGLNLTLDNYNKLKHSFLHQDKEKLSKMCLPNDLTI